MMLEECICLKQLVGWQDAIKFTSSLALFLAYLPRSAYSSTHPPNTLQKLEATKKIKRRLSTSFTLSSYPHDLKSSKSAHKLKRLRNFHGENLQKKKIFLFQMSYVVNPHFLFFDSTLILDPLKQVTLLVQIEAVENSALIPWLNCKSSFKVGLNIKLM